MADSTSMSFEKYKGIIDNYDKWRKLLSSCDPTTLKQCKFDIIKPEDPFYNIDTMQLEPNQSKPGIHKLLFFTDENYNPLDLERLVFMQYKEISEVNTFTDLLELNKELTEITMLFTLQLFNISSLYYRMRIYFKNQDGLLFNVVNINKTKPILNSFYSTTKQ